MKRELLIRRIKAGRMESYLDKHANYWPDLKKEMVEGGFRNITCFVDGYNLFVYREYDELIFNSKDSSYFVLNRKWADFMKAELEPICIKTDEVFHLDGKL